jgi:hypothetical protein
MARGSLRTTAPVSTGSWGRNGRSRFGSEKTHWRTDSGKQDLVAEMAGDLHHAAGVRHLRRLREP